MTKKRARSYTATLALILFLALTIQAAPSHPAIPGSVKAPLGAIHPPANHELADLLAGRRFGPRLGLGLGIVSAGDVTAALGAQPRHFSMFSADSAVDGRRELLRRLPFGAILEAAGERNHVDGLLLAAVVEMESQFAPRAVSPEGAMGLMQLLPSTGRDYGVKNLLDPYANVDAGSRYLRALLDRFKRRQDLAIAAYNTGPEVVARYGCVPPFRETQGFVKKVLGRYAQHLVRVPPAAAARDGQDRRDGREGMREAAGR
jgi:hypothetical protein